MKPALFDRYLEDLGVEPGPPSLELLIELVSAQVVAAPFENISKLYRHRTTGSTTTALSGRRELIDVVEDRFGVPAEVVRTAIEGVDLTADIYS